MRPFFLLIACVLTSLFTACASGQDKAPSLPSGDTFFTGKGQMPYSLERDVRGIVGCCN